MIDNINNYDNLATDVFFSGGYMDFSDFLEDQGRSKKLYIVIHVTDPQQAVAQADIAFSAGADGIFLICHDNNYHMLLAAYDAVRKHLPDWFIGLNFLDQYSQVAFDIATSQPSVSALWADDSGVGDTVSTTAQTLREHMLASNWPGYYFPSVAFKGQRPVSDLVRVSRAATRYGHVTVTSGPQTGSPPDVTKIAAMKAAAPEHPLAIASGIGPDNVRPFIPHADIFMVSTSISDSFTELNFTKAQLLAETIHSQNN